MNRYATRKFTLIDAMILIAATALGCAGIRAESTRHLHPSTTYIERPFASPPSVISAGGHTTVNAFISYSSRSFSIAGPISGLGGYSAWFSKIREWAGSARLAAPFLVALSLAMLVIRLRQPRPAWRRLTRQAGLVASLGALVALVIRLGHASIKLLLEHSSPTMSIPVRSAEMEPNRSSWLICQMTQPHLIGVVVLASWLVLALGGRRRERSWIDRGAITVGLGWVSLLVVDLFLNEPS